jgi:hypothetical protein
LWRLTLEQQQQQQQLWRRGANPVTTSKGLKMKRANKILQCFKCSSSFHVLVSLHIRPTCALRAVDIETFGVEQLFWLYVAKL